MDTIDYITKYKKDCAEGKHIPVAEKNASGEIVAVYCQECGVAMTLEQHKTFFHFFNKRLTSAKK